MIANTLIIDHVERAIRLFDETEPGCLVSAAIVGSQAPNSFEPAGGDLDVVVVVRKLPAASHLVRLFSDPESRWTVVNTWGVVNPHVIGKPAIHLLLDPLDHYLKQRSVLFRRSVAKYPAIVGLPLTSLLPAQPMTSEELVGDWDGPVRLLECLRARRFESRSWYVNGREPTLAVSENDTAEPVDHALYAALHSARNVLRLRGRYLELSPTATLPVQWAAGMNRDDQRLARLVDAKARRRCAKSFDDAGVGLVMGDAEAFLQDTIELLEAWEQYDR